MAERRIPGPGIGTDHLDAVLTQKQSGLAPNTAPLVDVPRSTIGSRRSGVYQHDVKGLQLMADSGQLGLHVCAGGDITVRELSKIQLRARPHKQIQWRLIYRGRAPRTMMGGRVIVP